MRTLTLVFLTLAAGVAGACRPATQDTGRVALDVPERDLTLQHAAPPAVTVASPVELGQPEPIRRRPSRRQRQPRAAAAPSPSPASGEAEVVTPVAALGAVRLEPAVLAEAEAEPPDPHALPPGRSVTVLPASAGTATDEGWTHELPAERERGVSIGGGTHGGCKPGGGTPGVGRPEVFR